MGVDHATSNMLSRASGWLLEPGDTIRKIVAAFEAEGVEFIEAGVVYRPSCLEQSGR